MGKVMILWAVPQAAGGNNLPLVGNTRWGWELHSCLVVIARLRGMLLTSNHLPSSRCCTVYLLIRFACSLLINCTASLQHMFCPGTQQNTLSSWFITSSHSQLTILLPLYSCIDCSHTMHLFTYPPSSIDGCQWRDHLKRCYTVRDIHCTYALTFRECYTNLDLGLI